MSSQREGGTGTPSPVVMAIRCVLAVLGRASLWVAVVDHGIAGCRYMGGDPPLATGPMMTWMAHGCRRPTGTVASIVTDAFGVCVQ